MEVPGNRSLLCISHHGLMDVVLRALATALSEIALEIARFSDRPRIEPVWVLQSVNLQRPQFVDLPTARDWCLLIDAISLSSDV